MAVLCPPRYTRPDGAVCEKFDEFYDSYLGGLVKIHICSYKCNDGTYYSRWRMQCCCIRFGIREHVFDPEKKKKFY